MDYRKEHTVYFEIFGKKMKTKVMAFNSDDAKNEVKKKIKFHKVIDNSKNCANFDGFFDMFKDLLG